MCNNNWFDNRAFRDLSGRSDAYLEGFEDASLDLALVALMQAREADRDERRCSRGRQWDNGSSSFSSFNSFNSFGRNNFI